MLKLPKKVRCSRCSIFMKRFKAAPGVRVFRCPACITTSICTDGSLCALKIADSMMGEFQAISQEMGIETQVTVKARGNDGSGSVIPPANPY